MTAEETCNLILEEFKARSGVKTYVGQDHMIIALRTGFLTSLNLAEGRLYD